jgi:hypothetical protein
VFQAFNSYREEGWSVHIKSIHALLPEEPEARENILAIARKAFDEKTERIKAGMMENLPAWHNEGDAAGRWHNIRTGLSCTPSLSQADSDSSEAAS